MRIKYQRGVHLPDFDLWLDPHDDRPFAFVSHAHSDHIGRHRETVLSAATAQLMHARLGHNLSRREHILAFHQSAENIRPGLRFTLLPAGHILGSAMLFLENLAADGGESLLYTGDFKLRPGLSAEPAETCHADTLIMETTFGLPRFVFPPTAEIVAAVVRFCVEALEDDAVPVLFGYSLGKGQEIIAALAGAGLPVVLHGAVHRMTEVVRTLRPDFPPAERYSATADLTGKVLICPPSAANSRMLQKIKSTRTAMLTGWALNPGAHFRYGTDTAFPLSDHADYPDLLRLVELVRPRRVLTLHGYAAAFARDLRERGVEAWALSEENQLDLALSGPTAAGALHPAATAPDKQESAARIQETAIDNQEIAADSREMATRTAEMVAPRAKTAARTPALPAPGSASAAHRGETVAGHPPTAADSSAGEAAGESHVAPADAFSRFVSVCEAMAGTTGKLKKTEYLAAYFRTLDDVALPIATLYLAGRAFAQNDPRVLNVGSAVVRRALLAASGVPEARYRELSAALPDQAETTFLLLRERERARDAEGRDRARGEKGSAGFQPAPSGILPDGPTGRDASPEHPKNPPDARTNAPPKQNQVTDAPEVRPYPLESRPAGMPDGAGWKPALPFFTLADSHALFTALAAARGPLIKTEILQEALARLPAAEARYVVKILGGELRIGLKEGLLEEALAVAFDRPPDAIREANMLLGDLGKVALLAKSNRLAQAELTLFQPIKSMLASPEPTAEAIWARHEELNAVVGGGEADGESQLNDTKAQRFTQENDGQDAVSSDSFAASLCESPRLCVSALNEPAVPAATVVWIEDKFDGVRAQLHRAADGRVEIYSRDLRRVTAQFDEIARAASALLRDVEVILDGEIVAYQEGRKLTFFDLQKRLGRREADLFMQETIPLSFFAFDLLRLGDRALLGEPLATRRALLETLPWQPPLRLVEVTQAASAAEIEATFNAARGRANEGLIVKDPRSFYTPGRRGLAWLKLKKELATLDVVIVGAEWGHGKRNHVLSDYTFAVRDEARGGELATIGKAYSGLTDAEIAELTPQLQESTIEVRGKYHAVRPEIVLEIAFDSIQPSTRHTSGLALRFPRIKAIRADKTPAEIDTVEFARKLCPTEP